MPVVGDGGVRGAQAAQRQAIVPVAAFTVKQATLLQLGGHRVRRAALHAAFVTDALGPLPPEQRQPQQPHAPQLPPPPPPQPLPGGVDTAAANRVALLLRDAWAIRWENRFKEALWRLSIDAARHPGNGIMRRAAAGGSAATTQAVGATQHAAQQQPQGQQQGPQQGPQCHCRSGACSNAHHYHTCAVAAAVYGAIGEALPGQPQVLRHHIWLAEPPLPLLHKDLWLVVCMAALTAMEHGRKRLVSLHFRQQHQEPVRQTHITDFFQPFVDPAGPATSTSPATHTATMAPQQTGGRRQRRPSHVDIATDSAVMQFWMCLHNFADVGLRVQTRRRRQQWLRDVPADHPLLAITAGCLVVNGGP
jgi:hypothetical protein